MPERLDKIADICVRMPYSSAHGLSPFEIPEVRYLHYIEISKELL
jgi:hypothetical protein